MEFAASAQESTFGVSDIQVYSTIGCKYCRIAKAKLESLGLTYVNIDVNNPGSEMSSILQERVTHAKSNTVPQIYIGKELIGGCSDLIAMIEKKELDSKLTAIGQTIDLTAVKEKKVIINNAYDECLVIPEPGEPLNSKRFRKISTNADAAAADTTTTIDLISLSKNLQESILTIFDDYVINQGTMVDYEGLCRSHAFHDFVAIAAELDDLPNLDVFLALDGISRFIFFCNLYNVMVIHAKVILFSNNISHEMTIAQRSEFFTGKSGFVYRLGGHIFSLDDIEHGILRANHLHPSQTKDASGFWSKDDPRCILSLPEEIFDPRVHFILNCGAKSCPPIKILDHDNYQQALAAAAAAFLKDEVKVDPIEKKITSTRLIMWYGSDFGASMLQRFTKLAALYPAGSKEQALMMDVVKDVKEEPLEEGKEVNINQIGEYTIDYPLYNWGSNGIA